ncbi:MAG: sigma-70 family RNA polymerase sigma factor [Planctomycetes bacterium]|nr:sigma-70 family RNA polymerase sigma factor [Planctomycetota bacterium]MCC7398140.1 sigma-70 family RNA polymerase sigma factor [Planctomycetota bacterium]
MKPTTPDPLEAKAVAAAPAWVTTAATRLRRYLRCLRCPADLADDFAQDALLAALREGQDEPPLPWLMTVARNCWAAYCRRTARAPSPADLQRWHDHTVRELGDDGGDAAVAALRQCVSALPARSRRALDLCYRDGLPRAAAAGALGLGVDGLKSLLARLRAALKDCIERRRQTHG